ncbi:MAG: class I tRNA ligase family protein, partial [Flavobacterium sp.]|uniref:class I tRNA ligase family protein n=1 Tax=Flavobacterium sp. TaxID=239 RepID=UPI00261219EC
MKYNPNEIEAKWQKYWAENQTFKAYNPSSPPLEGLGEDKPKYYVLDMFPYPSGAGLHVGHPLGYIASDVYSRYKRHRGFNVLHPMGYDSFGLPAEQYAIQTGQRPEDTTSVNIDGGVDKEGNKIAGYRKQLDKIGFSFDWSREVRTSNPDYYKHTQWIFIQLFNSWYNKNTDKAEDISTLISVFSTEGNANVNAVCDDNISVFSSSEWNAFSPEDQQRILLQYRLTYLAETEVNWCPGLGTVLANDEIVNGVSERGGFPVIRKKMTQWSMRISAYAERLLQGLDTIDWSESIKESQRNWIGKSVGAMVSFKVRNQKSEVGSEPQYIDVFTTRPDTIFGVTFMTLAPEHPLVQEITTADNLEKVNDYIFASSKRSERERMADVKT